MTDIILSVFVNLLLLAGLPLLVYYLLQRFRHDRSFDDVLQRTGLVPGESVYILYSLGASVLVVIGVLLFPPSIADSTAEGSAFAEFTGLGLSGTSILMALMYGVIKTGFAEEFLFRGLITGSLARRMPELWANVTQSVIFLLPHLFILVIAPDMWPILPVVFLGALFKGWIRIRSGSIIGPWMIHASANVTMALSVAMRSAG